MRVLVVEDSRQLRASLTVALRESGYAVDATDNGEEGLWLARGTDYDVLVLDIMIPGRDGLSVLAELRAAERETRVLLLTARDTVEDRVRGLRAGADDYLTKPFALEELLARVEALCRRAYGRHGRSLRVGDLEVDTVSKTVERGGASIGLTAREYALLEYLAMRAGTVLSRSEIEAHIYDDVVSPTSNVVDAAVYALRKKIAVTDGARALIHTRRGLGYVLEDRGLEEGGA